MTAHAQPHNLHKGTLFVNVDSSVWLSEIVRYRRKEILDRLAAQLREKSDPENLLPHRLTGAENSAENCNIYSLGLSRLAFVIWRVMQSVRRAVIDVGTNSIKLLVADVRGRDVQPGA